MHKLMKEDKNKIAKKSRPVLGLIFGMLERPHLAVEPSCLKNRNVTIHMFQKEGR